jgi:hypothetical protein
MFDSLSAIVPTHFLVANGHSKPEIRHALFAVSYGHALVETRSIGASLMACGYTDFGLAALVDGEIEPLAIFAASDFVVGHLETVQAFEAANREARTPAILVSQWDQPE